MSVKLKCTQFVCKLQRFAPNLLFVNYNDLIVQIRKHSFLFVKNGICLKPSIQFLFQSHACVCNLIMHPKYLTTEKLFLEQFIIQILSRIRRRTKTLMRAFFFSDLTLLIVNEVFYLIIIFFSVTFFHFSY